MALERISDTWEYDGSFGGFLTVVQQAFQRQQLPAAVLAPERAVENLFFSEWITTQPQLAERILLRLEQRLTAANFQFFQQGFHSSLADKERCLLETLEIALTTRDSLENFLGHPAVLALSKSIKSLLGEAHVLTGFVRFEYVGQLLFSKIEPKHFSLPYICPHFAERYPLETIMIYDETHRLLALIEKGRVSFIEDSDCPQFETEAAEAEINQQWQRFLQAVTIQERINPEAQRGHLPLRFRSNMVEFK